MTHHITRTNIERQIYQQLTVKQVKLTLECMELLSKILLQTEIHL